jgi:hypothetical protein
MTIKEVLDEESERFRVLKEEWRTRAKTTTLASLPQFLSDLTTKYEHDYGTICHAMTFAALAAMYAVNHSSQGGVTGFQAGCIMWGVIREWSYSSNKTGMKLINYDEFLYPQHGPRAQKTFSRGTWEALKKEAADKLKQSNQAIVSPNVWQHWESIVAGCTPFGYTVEE